MSTIPAKQINKNLSAFVRINGFSASGSSSNATSVITTALSTAGDGGVSVPLQVATGSDIGVLTSTPNNRVEIYGATSKDKILASNGEEVYGRVAESDGTYTLDFFTLSDTGTEAAHSFSSTTAIDFEFAYRFDFARFPSDGVVRIQTRNIANDPGAGGGGQVFRERLTITALNTVSVLSKTPVNTTGTTLIINGISYDTFGGAAAPFTINTSTRAITWSASNAGFNLETTDRVIAEYTTTE